MLSTYLPRSQAALKRHQKRIDPELARLRKNEGFDDKSDLELVLYALGDESTQRALATYWLRGGTHPITSMAEEDVRALDRGIAQAIVLSATCNPAVRVRQRTKRPGQQV